MSIELALADAANNCARQNATVVLTLRGSGVRIEGKLEKPTSGMDTVVVRDDAGGWETVLVEEVAAVASVPSRAF